MTLKDILAIRRDERWPVLLTVLVATVLNTVFVQRMLPYVAVVTDHDALTQELTKHFRLSGYDPFTISMVADWAVDYNPYRHPLYAFFLWPVAKLNQGLTALLGTDCSLPLLALLLVVNAVYGVVFLRRLLRDVAGLGALDANLLMAFAFSMAYMMLMLFVPEHFPFSMTLLLLAAWLSGLALKRGRGLTVVQTLVLFVLTAGVSLNNGVKVFLAALFTRGWRRFFRPRYLLLAVALPSALIWAFARFEYTTWVLPHEQAHHEKLAHQRAERRKALEQRLAAAEAAGDSVRIQNVKRAMRPRPSHMGRPISNNGFMKWTDVTTPRWPSVVENLLGESVQLHQDYTLYDGLNFRPVIVKYSWVWNYVLETVVVALFLVGIWCGRRQRWLWLLLSWLAFDMLIHLVLGFGLNEIYIMSPHFLFVVPVAVACLLGRLPSRPRWAMRLFLALLALWLWGYNLWLTIDYLQTPL